MTGSGWPPVPDTPFWDDRSRFVYCGDSLDVMGRMADESVDVVVTSPPYNMGLVPGGNGRGMYRPGANNKAGRFRDGYAASSDDMEPAAYVAWLRTVLAECWRVARVAVFFNHRPRVVHGRLVLPFASFPTDAQDPTVTWQMDFGAGPVLRQIITWDRGTGIDVDLRSFVTRGEWVMLFAKPAFGLVSHSMSGYGDVWKLGMSQEKDHPAPFPVSLPTRCLEATGAESVLDPFVGSGSTLRAAKDLGVRGVGIDCSEQYCRVTVDRLQQGSLFDPADLEPVPLFDRPDV